MATRLICTAVLVTCLGYMGGCATNVKIFPDEIEAQQQEKFRKVVVPARIAAVVLPPAEFPIGEDGELLAEVDDFDDTSHVVIDFDSLGGRLDSERRIVTGTTQESTFVKVAYDDILYVEVKGTDIGKRYTSLKDLELSRDRAREQPQKQIKPATSVYWDVIDFDKHGGRYDPLREVIIGASKRGTPLEIELDRVHYLQFKIYDPYKNLRIGIGVTALVVFFTGFDNVFGQ